MASLTSYVSLPKGSKGYPSESPKPLPYAPGQHRLLTEVEELQGFLPAAATSQGAGQASPVVDDETCET